MADSDHSQGVTAVARDLLEPPVVAAMAATTSASSSFSHDDAEEDGFTFAAVPRLPSSGALPGGRLAPLYYPVFGRPRSPPSVQDEEEEEGDLGTATVMAPLAQLLMEERGAPLPSEKLAEDDNDDGGLDGVPAETYCLWSPGASPAAGSRSSSPSPARCRKSGSTGSVLRWRQRVMGRSHSDGKEKFVFLKESSAERSSGGAGGGHGWMIGSDRSGKGGGGGGDRMSTFLPYKQDLVGFFANAGAFRRSYLPF
ncbi:hypothetical protein HU200_019205 [Digitaria exilis]|uniref:Uncharacterized protein n=1 Tax=Digitaria exilis TaxID=1010633 RepID=A0A835KHV3_9POAL|nr:hypothetical protein HU200_019205 [Digitaria exilis]CAB3460693.1 unnamed protein product [Digitaria exilis]